jgi:hypothetical protein
MMQPQASVAVVIAFLLIFASSVILIKNKADSPKVHAVTFTDNKAACPICGSSLALENAK